MSRLENANWGREYYLSLDGAEQVGPFSIQQLADSGIRGDAMAWCEGMPAWQRTDQILELMPYVVRSPQQSPVARSHYPSAAPAQTVLERNWTAHDQGRQFGPHTLPELAMLVGVGTISPAAMAWQAGSPQWVPISSVVPMPHQMTMARLSESQPIHSSNRILAGIMGLLFGGLGIHKFVLGYTGAGVIMLAITLLTCGYGWIVMGLIGFIEGVVYLTKSDREFHRDYVVRRREWF